MNLPKVAIVTPGSFELTSARCSSVELVVKEVSERLKQDVQLFLFGKSVSGLPAYEEREGITYIRVSGKSSYRYAREIASHLHIIQPDIVQVENRPRLVKWLRRLGPIRSRYWLSLHSTTFISRPHIGLKELQRCVKSAHSLTVNSHFLKRYVQGRVQISAAKCRVNYLGVDTDLFVSRWEPEQAELRQQQLEAMGYRDKRIILYVGRLMKEKGVHHILNVMPHIARRFPEAVLVVVGSAYYGSDRLTPYVKKLFALGSRTPANVRFVSFVPHDHIHAWFRLADFVVVPSFRKEAFGLVNVEAMATGVPVIATKAGGMKEIIVHEQTGYLLDSKHIEVEMRQRFTSLLENPQLCKQLGEASVRHVRHNFTWDLTAARLLQGCRERW